MVSWWQNFGVNSLREVKCRALRRLSPLFATNAPASSDELMAALGAGAGSVDHPEIKSYVIRLASVNDCAAIARLELASAQFEQRLMPLDFTWDELRDLWRQRILSGEFHVLIAEGKVEHAPSYHEVMGPLLPVSSQLLGFVGFKAPPGGDGFIQAIYVAPAFYRLGLGGALLAASEKIMKRQGCRRVTLLVEPFNRMGHCFYRKAGFYRLNRKHRHLDILVKELSSC